MVAEGAVPCEVPVAAGWAAWGTTMVGSALGGSAVCRAEARPGKAGMVAVGSSQGLLAASGGRARGWGRHLHLEGG